MEEQHEAFYCRSTSIKEIQFIEEKQATQPLVIASNSKRLMYLTSYSLSTLERNLKIVK